MSSNFDKYSGKIFYITNLQFKLQQKNYSIKKTCTGHLGGHFTPLCSG